MHAGSVGRGRAWCAGVVPRARQARLAVVGSMAILVVLGAGCGFDPPPPPPEQTRASGVVVTPEGMVAPVLASHPEGWWVRTPCYRMAFIERGDDVVLIERVDVVVDPGHGGPEQGAVGVDGLEERDVNAAVARLVAEELERDGVTVLVTHPDDYQLTLRTRAEIIGAVDPDLAVSIHHNSVYERIGDEPGTLTLYQRNSSASRRLAGLLHEALRAELGPLADAWAQGNEVGPHQRESRDEPGLDYFGLLRFSAGTPVVIVEAAFLSSGGIAEPPPEAPLLATAAFRMAEARAIVSAIHRYRDEWDDARRSAGVSSEPPAYPAGRAAGDAADCVDAGFDTGDGTD